LGVEVGEWRDGVKSDWREEMAGEGWDLVGVR